MNDDIGGLLVVFVFLAAVLWCVAYSVGNEFGYRQGQIDALNGEVRYELKTQPDSTKVWVVIK